MIGNLTVNISAKDPTRKCEKFLTFLNSPSTVRIVGVPSAVGKWKISKVYFSINYPDNTSVSKECTAGAGVYVATVAGSSVAGTSVNGYTVTANATDETGASVTGFILGKGDVVVANTDGTITAGETTYYIHVLDSQPTTPKKGDAYVDTGYWKVYNGSSWVTLGGAFGSAQYVQYPVSEGGDGKWHRVIISDGAIAYDETGVDEPPTCATQAWVTTQIAAETTARTTAISSEATARQSADQTNADAIAAEATARASAVSAEASARASADEAEVAARNAAIASAIATETAARTAAISAEATARANADTAEATARNSAISSAIATEVTNRNSAISAEATARQNADSAEVTARNAAIAQAVAVEEARATAAENALEEDIDDEVTRATAAESAEASARAAADATKVSLDGAQTVNGVKTFTSPPIVPTPTANMEASTKKYVDDTVASEASARASAVSAEATARASAVSAEETARNSAIATAIAVGTSGNDLVHKSGSETITGAKTFSGTTVFTGSGGLAGIKSNSVDTSEIPSETMYVPRLSFYDKNGISLGEVRRVIQSETAGNYHSLGLLCQRWNSSTSRYVESEVTAGVSADNIAYIGTNANLSGPNWFTSLFATYDSTKIVDLTADENMPYSNYKRSRTYLPTMGGYILCSVSNGGTQSRRIRIGQNGYLANQSWSETTMECWLPVRRNVGVAIEIGCDSDSVVYSCKFLPTIADSLLS